LEINTVITYHIFFYSSEYNLMTTTYHIVVDSLYPMTAEHPIAFMWERISILNSFHQQSRVSDSSY